MTGPSKGPQPIRFRSQGKSHNGSHADGRLSREGCGQDIDVFCELAEGDNALGLGREAGAYRLLGSVVPRFYGLYVGTYRDIGDMQNSLVYVLQEHCGRSVAQHSATFLDYGMRRRYVCVKYVLRKAHIQSACPISHLDARL